MNTARRRLLLPALALLAIAAYFAAGVVAQDAPYMAVSPQEATKLMRDNPDMVVLDVRTPGEQARGIIQGATLTSPAGVETLEIPRDKPVLLYCAVGGRSSSAAKVLAKRGYQNLYNLIGGIRAWQAQGLPVAAPPAQ